MTQEQISKLFDKAKSTINEHIIQRMMGLKQATNRQKTFSHGVAFYNYLAFILLKLIKAQDFLKK